ncbi:hypothetical protein HY29_16480 [Hyphomonas beringensis]|uniref:Uncharacterized protein n=1 Tax=Hyphomonas beringensis TaxID=1280946 RepID=A0A062U7I0_9PROT|nr:hypothetical protein [Hyphomonas beringensis]KCZ53668.1 hypothetical protein HY29_16480 [Hyphomonas beringensis]
MTDTYGYLILGALVIVPVAKILATKIQQPARLSFAEMGRDLLENPAIDDEQAKLINRMLDDAFKWHTGLVMAFVATPVLLYFFIAELIGADLHDKDSAYRRLSNMHEGKTFMDRGMWCVLGSNPIAAIALFIQALPMALLYAVITGSMKAAARMMEERVFVFVGTAKRV